MKQRSKIQRLTWKEIEPWQRDNEFILTGYRAPSFSLFLSTQSIFDLHNETVNIWSHLLGAVQFLFALWRLLGIFSTAAQQSYTSSDSMAVSVYCLCVVACFLLSAAFHTFSDHSAEMHRFGNELDHLGIVLVMWGTGASAVHFAFYCEPRLQALYHVALLTAAAACAAFTLRLKFRTPAYRTMRFLVYCFLGLTLFAPAVHGSWLFGLAALDDRMSLRSFLGLALINFSGAALYAARIPERWLPRKFDLIGQSHNWMHVLVMTGAMVRLQGLLHLIDRWHQDALAHGQCNGIL